MPARSKSAKPQLSPLKSLATLAMVHDGISSTTQRAFVFDKVAAYVRKYGPAPDSEGYYHAAIDAIAEALFSDSVSNATEELSRIDAVLKEHGRTGLVATDVACDRWTPNIRAALLFGVTLGIVIAYGDAETR